MATIRKKSSVILKHYGDYYFRTHDLEMVPAKATSLMKRYCHFPGYTVKIHINKDWQTHNRCNLALATVLFAATKMVTKLQLTPSNY